MSKEIQAQYPTGANIYAVVLNPGGQAWNGSAFETPTLANWSTYAITLAEQSTTGLYQGDFPILITTAGWYSYLGYLRATGSPLSTDTVIWSDKISWNGSAVSLPFDAVVIEAGINARQALAAILSTNVGKVSGMAANAPVFTGGGNSTTRVSATTDANGNRSAVTLNLPT